MRQLAAWAGRGAARLSERQALPQRYPSFWTGTAVRLGGLPQQFPRRPGFAANRVSAGENPTYEISIDSGSPRRVWSKVWDDAENPKENFIAVVNCSQADEGCLYIPGAVVRLGLLHPDPKIADNTANETQTYSERAEAIGREMLSLFASCREQL